MKVLLNKEEITIWQGDAAELLWKIVPSSVDAFITDPPYGIPVGSAFVRHNSLDVEDGSGTFNEAEKNPYWWLEPAAQALVSGGHAAFFVDRAQRVEAELALRSACLKAWHVFYLVKQSPPPTPRPLFVSAVEECIVAEKPGDKRRWYGTGYEPNRWIGLTPNRRDQHHGHPSEKPLDPIKTLVRCLTPPGGLVVDPFSGSGTTAVACLHLGRRCIAIERDPEYASLSAERLAAAIKRKG